MAGFGNFVKRMIDAYADLEVTAAVEGVETSGVVTQRKLAERERSRDFYAENVDAAARAVQAGSLSVEVGRNLGVNCFRGANGQAVVLRPAGL